MTTLRFALLSSLLFLSSADPGPATASAIERGPFFDKRQSPLTLPDCGQNCYSLALPEIGNCSQTDTSCLCQDQTFMTQAEQCFQTACSSADLTTILTLSQQICQSLGTTLYQVPNLADNLNVSVASVPSGVGTPTTLFSLPNITPSTATVTPASTSTPTPSLTTASSLATPTSPSQGSNTTSNRPPYSNQPVKPSIFSVASMTLDPLSCTRGFGPVVFFITLFFIS